MYAARKRREDPAYCERVRQRTREYQRTHKKQVWKNVAKYNEKRSKRLSDEGKCGLDEMVEKVKTGKFKPYSQLALFEKRQVDCGVKLKLLTIVDDKVCLSGSPLLAALDGFYAEAEKKFAVPDVALHMPVHSQDTRGLAKGGHAPRQVIEEETKMGGKRWKKGDIAMVGEVLKDSYHNNYDEVMVKLRRMFPNRKPYMVNLLVKNEFGITKSKHVGTRIPWGEYRERFKPATPQPQPSGPAGVGRWTPPERNRERLSVEEEIDRFEGTYVNVGVIYTTLDKRKAQTVLKEIKEVLENEGVRSYVVGADTSRLKLTSSPRAIDISY